MSADFILVQDRRLGRYVLKRALGEGGYGQVFLAWQDNATEDPLPCVVKFPLGRYARDEEAHRRFLHEARLAVRLGYHPNIVHVIDVDVHQGMPFIVMEYVDGVDLEVLLRLTRRLGRRLSLPAIYNILASAATGLHHAHSGATTDGKPVGIVHRDVKPANLLITRDGIVKLADFGIGVTLEERTTGNHWRGTPRYMSPEHMRCEVRPEMDIYGLGVVAWELVENRVYREECEGPQHYAPTKDGRIPPMLDTSIPEQLVAIIRSCLDPNPRRRPSAFQLIKALSRCPGYTRDPDVLKDEVASFIGTRRSSGVSQQHLAATPELLATFAVLAHPIEPVAPAGVTERVLAELARAPERAPVEHTLEVEVDAPRALRRPWVRRAHESTHPLGMASEAAADWSKTPVVGVPWFDHERATPPGAGAGSDADPAFRAARGLTEQAPRLERSERAHPARRSFLVQTSISIGVSIMAAALTAGWLGVMGDAPTEAVTTPPRAELGPAAEDIVESRTTVEQATPNSAAAQQLGSTPAPAPAAVDVAPSPAIPTTEVEQRVPEGPEDDSPTEPTVVTPVPSADPPADPPAVDPPAASVDPPAVLPARRKPTPRVSVTLVLSFIEEAEVRIGNEVSRVTRKTEIRVPAGTHRVRWRLPDETDWRDAGRRRFDARHVYLVRLRSTGAEIIATDGGSP